jgi:polyphosphate kinase
MTPRYLNRELSWLKFNARVLQEANDPSVPLIERLRFLGIFSNNLDEFFKVRYATIQRIYRAGKNATKSLGGISAGDLLNEINQTVIKDQTLSFQILNDLENELAKENIIVVDENEVLKAHEDYIRKYFNEQVSPALGVIMIDSKTAFPPLQDGMGYLAIRMEFKNDEVRHALIEKPKHLNRFVVLPDLVDGKKYVILIDDLIRHRMHYLFSIFDYQKIEAHMIKVTLDAQLDIDLDLKKSLLEKIRDSVYDRKDGDPVRFVFDREIDKDTIDLIMSKLEIDDMDSIIPSGRYHNRRDYLKFPSLGRKDLLYEQLTPLPIKNVDIKGSLLQRIAKKDILQYAPYHTFANTTKFLREAALDPHVEEVKITIYRLAEVSQIAGSLINAAKNGKSVTVSIELQARFDEQANINYAELMQGEGIQMIFGVPGLKVHCKACMITRREEGKLKRYGFISTGNFNESTAGIYTDYTLFTADKRILKEVERVFEFFEVNYKQHRYEHLLVSPSFLRGRIEQLVLREIAFAKAGKKAFIRLKLNSFSDFKMIDLFYEASQAGVQIELIIRGICCLVPGVKGMSENIKAISVVDRYLEHPRVYYFYNGGDTAVYISSADFMQRNLDSRVEIACPIYDEDIKKEILETLDICWKDNVKARILDEGQSNAYINNAGSKVRSQYATYEYYQRQINS